MNTLERLVGSMRYEEILSDIEELKYSKSYIHLDELIVKYGEVGAKELICFMVHVRNLNYFDLSSKNGEPNLYYLYYLKHKDACNKLFLELL